MDFAFIKDDMCINIAVFDSQENANTFRDVMITDKICDDIVMLDNGFGIGDSYENGVWTKQEIPEPVYEPTPEDRIEALEAAMNFMLGM